MEKLTEILKDLEQGKISADNAESRVLRLLGVSGELPTDWCLVKAKIIEDGDHINDGRAMVVSVPRIDDPSRQVEIYIWKYNVIKGGNFH